MIARDPHRLQDCRTFSRQSEHAGLKASFSDMLFADDRALNTMSEFDVRRKMNLFAAGCPEFGLTTNTARTLVTCRPSSNDSYSFPRIHVNTTEMETMDNFADISGTLLLCIKIDNEMVHRIPKASQIFGGLQNPV
ncbi:hypothetical protein SprV_0301186000 [Sparganum proliferum]